MTGTTPAKAVFDALGITIKGDGTCDGGGFDELARRFPVGRERVGGQRRGCVPVIVGDWGDILPAEPNP